MIFLFPLHVQLIGAHALLNLVYLARKLENALVTQSIVRDYALDLRDQSHLDRSEEVALGLGHPHNVLAQLILLLARPEDFLLELLLGRQKPGVTVGILGLAGILTVQHHLSLMLVALVLVL